MDWRLIESIFLDGSERIGLLPSRPKRQAGGMILLLLHLRMAHWGGTDGECSR